jgi:hypothetical protein
MYPALGDELGRPDWRVADGQFKDAVGDHPAASRGTAVEAEGERVQIACEVRWVHRTLVSALLQLEHMKRPSTTLQPPTWPHSGQTKPSGHRSH